MLISMLKFCFRLQIPVRPSKPLGFSYLHPNLPPSPPLSSVTSAISSPGHSPQGICNYISIFKKFQKDIFTSMKIQVLIFLLKVGAGQAFQPSSVDTKSNRLSVQIDNTAQQDQNSSDKDIKRSASNGNLLQTGNNGTNTPFISRAASYNSAVGHFGSEHKEPSVRNLDTSHVQRSERESISNSNNLHDNLTTLNRGIILHSFIFFSTPF